MRSLQTILVNLPFAVCLVMVLAVLITAFQGIGETVAHVWTLSRAFALVGLVLMILYAGICIGFNLRNGQREAIIRQRDATIRELHEACGKRADAVSDTLKAEVARVLEEALKNGMPADAQQSAAGETV